MTFYDWWIAVGSRNVYSMEDARAGWEAALTYSSVSADGTATEGTATEDTAADERNRTESEGVVEAIKRVIRRQAPRRKPARASKAAR